MKRITKILTSSGLVLSAALAFAGCSLLGGGGGDDASGGGDSGAPATDPTAYAQAPGTLMIKNGAVGYMIANKTAGTGYENTGSVAIVAETGDSWLVETATSASDGWVMGLTVSKEDGKVTAAVMGKVGEAGKEIKVTAATATGATGPDGVAEEVTIGIGSFASTKVVTDYGTSWAGTEGELSGVMLKYESKDASYELAKMPEAADADVGGTSLKIVKLVYSNDSEYWRSANAVVAALATAGDGVGTVKTVMSGMTIELTAVKTDAAAQLKWAE